MKGLNDLHFINFIGFVLIAIALSLPDSPLRIALGLPFVLLFPGYTLGAILYPRRGDLDDVERLALSFGLSLAIVPLIGLMLSLLPWGIHLKSVLISLGCFIAACSFLAGRARKQLSRTERFSIEILPLTAQILRLSWFQIGMGAVVTVSIAFLAWHLHAGNSPTREPFTEFYILGASGKAEGYPDRVIAGETAEVVLGVINHELQHATYKITIRVSDQVQAALGPLSLDDGQKWQQSVRFSPKRAGTHEKIEFFLLKDDNPSPYRRLHLWMKVISP